MYTLGINAAFHDCSATLVADGRVIAAAEEERFTRIKHGKRPVPFSAWQLPWHAVAYCLEEAGIRLRDIDQFGYSFDPALLWDALAPRDSIELPLVPSVRPRRDGFGPWDPLFLSYVVNAPRQLVSGAPHHLQERYVDAELDDVLARWHFVDHHLAHEASAFLSGPFEECAVLTLDGRGERVSSSCGHFDGMEYRRLRQVMLPHSLGLLYEDVTRYLGFLHSSDEYKVMALASYGDPRHADLFRRIVRSDGEGGYRIEPCDFLAALGPGRRRGEPFDGRHMDIARSLQLVLEETVLDMARWLHLHSGSEYLCMAGGVALNCVMNARIADEGPFRDVWVQPAAGDAGTSLGAALWLDFLARGRKRGWRMDHAFLGPAYDDAEIARFLARAGIRHRRLDDVAEEAAELLAAEKIIAWHQGRMEFGPRALGARSILASPRRPEMQARLNELKDREDFRPVAPVVLQEHAHEWFDDRGRGGIDAPFMLFVFDVRPGMADRIPAVRHTDGTARVQTVRKEQNPLLHALLEAFAKRTGVPVLVNTSFNTRGEPVVCSPRDALESFFTSPLDSLVIGNFLVEKPS